jgi:hypothetical protein
MADLRYCPNCKKNTYTEIDMDYTILVILLILLIIPGLVYYLYCHDKKNRCAICKLDANQMSPPKYDNNQ